MTRGRFCGRGQSPLRIVDRNVQALRAAGGGFRSTLSVVRRQLSLRLTVTVQSSSPARTYTHVCPMLVRVAVKLPAA